MTWIFLWDTAPSKIFVWDTQVSKVFVWDTKVRPTWWWGWQPWANTVAYYPLTSTSQWNDMKGSGTAYNLSVNSWWTVTYTTVWWISVMQWWAWYLTWTVSTIPIWATARTLSIWAYLTSVITNTDLVMWQYWTRSRHRNQLMSFHTYDGRINPYLWNHYDDYADWGSYTVQTWQWYHIIYTYNWTTQTMYVNNTLYATPNTVSLDTSNTAFNIGWCSLSATNKFTWYLSECIIENVAWSAQEVSDYYNLTKWNYWIS